jgi:DNA-binding transcriptional MerR regulator
VIQPKQTAEQLDDAAPRGGKSASAFRTISEVASELDVPAHVLRFWESKFPQIKPLKRGGGRRYYRPEDVDLLRRIRTLLYRDGYTIKGAQKLLRTPGQRDDEGDLPLGLDAPDMEAPRPVPRPTVVPRSARAAAPRSVQADIPFLPAASASADEAQPVVADGRPLEAHARLAIAQAIEELTEIRDILRGIA